MPIDQRFYRVREALTYRTIFDKLGLHPRNVPERNITGIASFEAATGNDLCFFEGDNLPVCEMQDWQQGACFVKEVVAECSHDIPQLIGVPDPKQAFLDIASSVFIPKQDSDQATAIVHESAYIGANTVIGSGAAIGPETQIGHLG